MRRIELISILTNTLDGVVRTGLFRPVFIVIRIDQEFSERVDAGSLRANTRPSSEHDLLTYPQGERS